LKEPGACIVVTETDGQRKLGNSIGVLRTKKREREALASSATPKSGPSHSSSSTSPSSPGAASEDPQAPVSKKARK
jgi:hypothetical protein